MDEQPTNGVPEKGQPGDVVAATVTAMPLPEDFTRAMAQTRHELRTPLNHIIGYSELLLDEAEEQGLGDLTGDLSKIRDAGRRLLGMLNALLTPDALASRLVASGGVLPTGSGGAPAPLSPLTAAMDRAPRDESAVAELAFASILAPFPDVVPLFPAENPLLVVDDDPSNREVLGRLLSGMGYPVMGAADGAAALAILSAYPCDAVFLDIMMPVMDGYQALVEIRGDANLRHVPVIMVSALDEIQVVARCIEAGAEDYLPKPFNPTILKARLVAALEKKRLRDQERALYAELAVAHDKLQKAERLREDMTRLLVQDLRMPLMSLLTSLEMSAHLGDEEPATERREFLELAIKGGDKTLAMVNGLLDIASAEDGVLPLERTLYPPIPVAQHAALHVAELARAKGVTCELRVDTPELPPLYVDSGRIRHALISLLENAIKWTADGGRITLSVAADALPSGAPAVAFRVEDTGAAVPSGRSEDLLDRFDQVEARQDGLRVSPGLALTFAKYVAEAHGGELRIDGHGEERGAIFSLVLPLTS